MRDLYHNVLVTQHFNPAVSSVTRTSTAIDLQGFNSANVVFCIGQSADTLSGAVYWTLKLQHSDDDSLYNDVTLADLNNSALTVVINSSALDRTAYGFGYIGNKRYLKAIATPTGTHTNGTPIGMIAMRNAAAYSPVI
jgi:hypothetical protein